MALSSCSHSSSPCASSSSTLLAPGDGGAEGGGGQAGSLERSERDEGAVLSSTNPTPFPPIGAGVLTQRTAPLSPLLASTASLVDTLPALRSSSQMVPAEAASVYGRFRPARGLGRVRASKPDLRWGCKRGGCQWFRSSGGGKTRRTGWRTSKGAVRGHGGSRRPVGRGGASLCEDRKSNRAERAV